MISAYEMSLIEDEIGTPPQPEPDVVNARLSLRLADRFDVLIDPLDPYDLSMLGLKVVVKVETHDLPAVAERLWVIAHSSPSKLDRRAAVRDLCRLPSRRPTAAAVAA